MSLALFLSTLLITLLGVAYVKGYDIVKSRSQERLPQFYLIMAAVRIVLIATMIVLVILFTEDKAETREFVLYTLILYGLMMVTTLVLRH
ncbi:MAG: hypothetical protein J6W19_07635 [Prevotella sp.]|nr:hypothetical protein [Prevotella sp.]